MVKNLEELLVNWKFPKNVVEKYKSIHITEIFDWQSECLQIQEVLDGKNLLYSAPTSAGKTLVAELLMLKNLFDSKRKAILIFPFVSLAREKLKHLQWLLSDSFLKIDGFIGSSSPNGGFNSVDIAVCTIEKANSLINRLIDDDCLFDVGCMVIDELHMVNDGGRGHLLELILSKVKYLSLRCKHDSKIQLIGMSATLPNLEVLADWLQASLYQTQFRPIALKECVKYDNCIYDKNMHLLRKISQDPCIENDPDLLSHLVLETIMQKLGVLVFCPTKARCETLAENIARSIYSLAKNHNNELAFLDKDKIMNCLSELKNTPAGLDCQLSKTVRFGIAFHHAGLTVEEREIIENNFKQGSLLVIVCTSTLSNGINFPARRVIIRTPINFGKPIEVMNYKQMSGRAGRKGIDTEGESIIMCSNVKEKQIAEDLINSELKEIVSNEWTLGDELKSSVKRALLETIVSGIASKLNEILEYTSCFLTNRSEPGVSEEYLNWLKKNEFISIVEVKKEGDEIDGSLVECCKPTQLGYAVVAAAMSPDEGLLIFGELQKALQCFVLSNELHIIYQITPINICDYWLNSASHIDWNLFYSIVQNFNADLKRVSELIGVRLSFILKMIKGSSVNNCDNKLLKIHLRFYTCLILNDLVNEVNFTSILNKYGCQKGFLQTLQQSSSTYAAMIHVFCNRLGWYNLEILVEQFQSRLMFGVQRQLLDLIRIKLLNSHRARLFYNAGYTTVASIATCDLKKLEKILRSSLQFVSSKQDQENKTNLEGVIWHEGVSYTYWDACSEIFQDANDLLKMDLEQLGINIDLTTKKTLSESKNKSTVNKSMFEFNETNIDSIIQSQKEQPKQSEIQTVVEDIESEKIILTQKITSTSSQKKYLMLEEIKSLEGLCLDTTNVNSQIKVVSNCRTNTQHLLTEIKSLEGLELETQANQIIVDDSLNETTSNSPAFLNLSKKGDSGQKNTSITRRILVDDSLNETFKSPSSLNNSKVNKTNQASNSFWDDQFMLEAVKLFEKVDSSVDKQVNEEQIMLKAMRPLGEIKHHMNTTSVSEDIIEMCQMFENKNNLQPAQKVSKNDLSTGKENHIRADRWRRRSSAKFKTLFGSDEETSEDLVETVKVPEAFNRLEFIETIKKQTKSQNINITIIETDLEYNEFTQLLKPKSLISLSFCTERPNQLDNEKRFFSAVTRTMSKPIIFYGVSVCLDVQKATRSIYFLLFRPDGLFLPHIRSLLERDDIIKVVFYAKQHYKLIYELLGVKINLPCYDPIVADWLLNQTSSSIFQIKQKYCPSTSVSVSAELRSCRSCYGCSSNKHKEPEWAETIQRGFIECLIGISCFDKVKLQLQLQNLWIYFAKIESYIVLLVARIELIGMGLNNDDLERSKDILVKAKREIEERVYSLAKREVNMNSSHDVAAILYDTLKLKLPASIEETSGEKFKKHHSTSKDVLVQLSSQHEMPKLIILWRKISHSLLNSVYPLDKEKVFEETYRMYRVHSTIDIFTVTGRMNFNDPCLQNIPKDFNLNDISSEGADSLQTENAEIRNDASAQYFISKLVGEEYEERDKANFNKNLESFISIRSLFVPSDDRIFISADYCQLEFRIVTNLCRDKLLMSIFKNTEHDVFVLLASKWLAIPIGEVDEEKRQSVKKILYGIIYGMSPKTLALVMDVSESEATTFIDSFKTTFPDLKKFISNQIESCKLKGHVETIRKRRRCLPGINSPDFKQRTQAERQAINTIVQGSASDLVKTAMVKIDKVLAASKINAFLVMQLHDELIYEVDKSDVEEVARIIRDGMEKCMDFLVEMKVKLRIGSNWGNLEKYE